MSPLKLSIAARERTYSIELPWWLLGASLAAGLLWQPATAWASHQFSDVPESHPFHEEIAWMADNGISTGYADGTFRPGAAVTRQAMAAFLSRLDSEEVFTAAADVETLRAQVTELERLLAGVSRADGTLLFEGMNVQVVSGGGETNAMPNGLGNLIVGYNENSEGFDRSGSHNVVVGANHGFNSYGGLVAGFQNRIQGEYATVTGGLLNVATGDVSSVSGGAHNITDAWASSVSGGYENAAYGEASSVSGGIERYTSWIGHWAAGSLYEEG